MPGAPITLVVSDLHLSTEPELDDFYADGEFEDFVRHHVRAYASVHLVINGDWIDFQQIDPTPEDVRADEVFERVYPLAMTPEQAVRGLERTMERHPRFFAALRELVSVRDGTRRLTILRGNHDIELAFPAVTARLSHELGDPPAGVLAFPPQGFFDAPSGTYIEHGNQFDPINAFRDVADPFVDKAARRIEVPFGTVIVKALWNRIERELPFVDKVRPMGDSVAAVFVQRPTFALLRFDYLVDLMRMAWRQNLTAMFARRPDGKEPPADSPAFEARRHWRRSPVGGISLLVLLVLGLWVGLNAALAWEAAPTAAAAGRVRYLLHGVVGQGALGLAASMGVLVFARLARMAMARLDVWTRLRVLVYRLLVVASALAFAYGVVRLLWIPLLIAVVAHIVHDAARTLSAPAVADHEPLLRKPLAHDVAAAIRLLRHPAVRCVVFGHTHQPMQLDLGAGKRYVNSGTWVRVLDVRDVRGEPFPVNPYVAITGDEVRLMSWRGTEPARAVAV